MFSYKTEKKILFDLLLGVNLLARFKILEGSFYGEYYDNKYMEDAKLYASVFQNYSLNIHGGIGMSYYLKSNLLISGNYYYRLICFRTVDGIMGEDIDLGGIPGLDWINHPNFNFQISTKFLFGE